jgi:hypothetical protein
LSPSTLIVLALSFPAVFATKIIFFCYVS